MRVSTDELDRSEIEYVDSMLYYSGLSIVEKFYKTSMALDFYWN